MPMASSCAPMFVLVSQKLPTGLPGGLFSAVFVNGHSCTEPPSHAVPPVQRVPPESRGEINVVVAFAGARQPTTVPFGPKLLETKVESMSSVAERADVPLKMN